MGEYGVGSRTNDFPTPIFVKRSKRRFLAQWKETIICHAGPDKKRRTYTKFKDNFEIEKYLLAIRDDTLKRNTTSFRISAHNFKIETGRHRRKNTIRRKVVCKLSNCR